MSLHDDLQKKLSTEQMQQLDDILGDDFDWDLVPRSRLNKVIGQRNELKKQLATGLPPKDAGKSGAAGAAGAAGEMTDDTGTQGPTYSEEEVQQLLQAERDKAANASKLVEVKYATLSKLQEAKARDLNLVFGLLDTSKLAINDKNELTGLKEAGLEELQKNKPYLFEEQDVPAGTGKRGGAGAGGGDALDAAIANVFAGYTFDGSESK